VSSRLSDSVRAGDRQALARAITMLEQDAAAAREVLAEVGSRSGPVQIVGVTGPPGVGKSTLIAALAERICAEHPVGIVSVDPSSPISSGALLGDRIRMRDLEPSANIYIRSMASHGSLGGLSTHAYEAALLMSAAGYRHVFIETVGVGQSEVEIHEVADTVVLVLAPGNGDYVQLMKSGVMEIPDVIVVNKSDVRQSAYYAAQIRASRRPGRTAGWVPPVLLTQARAGAGIDEVGSAIAEHAQAAGAGGPRTERRALAVTRSVLRQVLGEVAGELEQALAGELAPQLHEVIAGRASQRALADSLLAWLAADRQEAGRLGFPHTEGVDG
jgi:LAO/AO transport system kinase